MSAQNIEQGEANAWKDGGSDCVDKPASECQNLFSLEKYHLATGNEVIVYGYLVPALSLFTLVTNAFVILVLLQRHMRSATNVLLLSMAVADTLTSVSPIPSYVYFFTFGNYREWMAYSWCPWYDVLALHLPVIFHRTSIWLTLALAAQRFLCVWRPFRAKMWCSVSNTVKAVLFILILAIASHMSCFFDTNFTPVKAYSLRDRNNTLMACEKHFVKFTKKYDYAYFKFQWWFRVVFVHLMPCTLLVVLNILLIKMVRKAQRQRQALLMQNQSTEATQLHSVTVMTRMLVTVMGFILLAELPLAIFMIVIIIENTFNVLLIDISTKNEATLFLNTGILMTYPINLFIYCGMSKEFRSTFKRLLRVSRSDPRCNCKI